MGLQKLRINNGALKTCVGKPLANVTFNILTIFSTIALHKSEYKTQINIFNKQRQIQCLILIWVGGNFTPCWFYLNNSETVKAATLAFSLETFAPNLVLLTHPSL